jgi:acetyl-CoA C-acetyltransferase/acetyl-CoA acyltransferase
VVLALGVEVQNSVKAIYGADILAAAGWANDRKDGHAFFFPGQFSARAGVYFERYGRDRTRRAFARWYRNAIENARLCPTAQEYHNQSADLESLAMAEPNGKIFVDYLNYHDCSKVSDGASAIAIASRDGLRRMGIAPEDTVEIAGFGHAVGNITLKPSDPTELSTGILAAGKALEMAEISIGQVGTVELHDCFTIAGILGVEALGLAKKGEGPDYVLAGETSRTGEMPFNTTGGLIGWGHPTGATGVHMAVTLWEQLTGRAGDAQIAFRAARPYGLSLNMGGDDKTQVCLIYKRGE